MSQSLATPRYDDGMTRAPGSTTPVKLEAMRLAAPLLRVSLAVIFLWFGLMKFTDYEASGITPLVMHSPFISWLHGLLGLKGTSIFIGIWEVVTGVLLAAGFWSRGASIAGAVGGVVTFLFTVSFLLTTPGMFDPRGGGFPAISHTGAFLLKDVVLLGACAYLLGESLTNRAISQLGGAVMTIGLVLVFLMLGFAKFYDYEASDIAPLVMHSPFVSWLHGLFGLKGTSIFIGVFELVAMILIAAKPFSAVLSTAGGALAGFILLVTLSFFLTTPGVCLPDSCPAISVPVGQFLLKDLGLLAAAFWVAVTSWSMLPVGRTGGTSHGTEMI